MIFAQGEVTIHTSPQVSIQASDFERGLIAGVLYKNGVHFNLNVKSSVLPATPKTVDAHLMLDILTNHGVDYMRAVSFASKQPLESARLILHKRLPGSPIDEVHA